MKTPKELKEIAVGIVEGNIFSSLSIPPGEADNLIHLIFMPLIFLTDEQREELIAKKPAVIFAHLKDAGPRAVNGYPIFMNMEVLGREEADQLVKYMEEYVSWRSGFIEEPPPGDQH